MKPAATMDRAPSSATITRALGTDYLHPRALRQRPPCIGNPVPPGPVLLDCETLAKSGRLRNWCVPGWPGGNTYFKVETLMAAAGFRMSDADSAERNREHRWVVVGEDGRFVTVGRHTDPSEDEILSTENALRSAGLAGWLAVMQGSPYAREVPRLLMVR